MNNSQYFAQYKTACEIIFASHGTDWLYLKDSEFKYQAMTSSMLKFIGMASLENVIDKTTLEIHVTQNESCHKLIAKFQKQDASILKSKKRGIYLEVIPHEIDSKIVIIYKTPIINPSTHEVVGIHGQINPMLWPNIIKTLFKMHGSKGLLLNAKHINDPLKDYPLTNIQHMVLFLSMHNYSYSEIALLMSEFGNAITPVQVNERLENLKLIFHVRTKAQLIEKAIGLDFHVILPCDLFNNIETIDISSASATIICCNCKLGICLKHSKTDAPRETSNSG
ncbi:MAG: hypothetical protein K2X04_12190 [Burkholderiales bacterium]|nr:hypothetical protein [Burkholderiales bacterium]